MVSMEYDPCPSCQIGHLEPYGNKMCCTNTRCAYTETCSDGCCGVAGSMPHLIGQDSPPEPEESSTAESDYKNNK